MTSAKIFKKFPALWDLFEKQLKEKYLIWLSEGRLKVFDPDKKELSNIYKALRENKTKKCLGEER